MLQVSKNDKNYRQNNNEEIQRKQGDFNRPWVSMYFEKLEIPLKISLRSIHVGNAQSVHPPRPSCGPPKWCLPPSYFLGGIGLSRISRVKFAEHVFCSYSAYSAQISLFWPKSAYLVYSLRPCRIFLQHICSFPYILTTIFGVNLAHVLLFWGLCLLFGP